MSPTQPARWAPRWGVPALGALAVLVVSERRAVADDSNRHRTPLAPEAVLSGDALVGSIRSSGAVWYNPAGLGGLKRSSVRMTISAYALRFRRIPDAIVVDLPNDRREGFDLSSRDWSIAPSATVIGLKLGSKVGLALSVLTPTFDESDLERFGTASAPGYSFVQQTKLVSRTKRYHIGASVGYALRSNLRLGASLFFVYEKDVLSGRLWAASDLRDLGVREFGSSDFFSQTRRYGGQVDLGAQWDPLANLSLGLMVRTPRFQVVQTVSGSSLSTLVAEFNGESAGVFDFQDEVEAQTPPKYEPIQLVWGAAWRWDSGEFAVQADVSPPQDGDGEKARTLVVDLAANVRVSINDVVELGGGLFSDQSSRARVNDPLDVRVDSYGVNVGAQWTRPLATKGDRTTAAIVLTGGLRYALGSAQFGRLAFDASDPVQGIVPSVEGEQDATFHDLSFSLATGVEF